MLYMLRQIFEHDETGKELLLTPQKFILDKENRKDFLESVSEIIDDIIVDFNGEVENLGADFDYKSKLRDDSWVKKVSQDVVSSYLKLVNRNRIDSFDADWKKRMEKKKLVI